MLTLKQIKKDYITASEKVEALKGVDIRFRKKEFVSILGPSGCGKTTLLNIIGGLDHYTDGDLVIGGRSTKDYKDRDWDVYRNHRVGFIFQSYNLIPHQTVLGNVELALTIAGLSKEERIERAKSALDRVGLSGKYYKRPNQLSGGQCQRVAIARALVNNPEILLADEPTGALDTVTSVQIMDLIKEISGERLVIMVTHNPEIAERYSSRIVRLLDGNVIEDTNPMTESEELEELNEEARLKAEEEKRLASLSKKEAKKEKKRGREKAKMSFFTAFRLSAKNLISKKGRTAMVGFAGSIGIIGIAMVLAFSAGIKGYVASMQDDMLSGNPITITETGYDMDALTGMMDLSQKEELIKNPNRVYINSLVEYLIETNKDMQDVVVENEITDEYVEYIKSLDEEKYSAMIMDYGINLNPNLFTSFTDDDGVTKELSVTRITDVYTAILSEYPEYQSMASMIPTLAPNMEMLPDNREYVESQYEMLGDGRFPENANEIVLVVDSEDELSDLLLARFGYYTEGEFRQIIEKALDTESHDDDVYRDSFSYDELLGKKFSYYPNDTLFVKLPELDPATTGQYTTQKAYYPSGYKYLSDASAKDFSGEGKIELTVVGILSPKDNINYGSMTSGIYYTPDFAEEVLDANRDSSFLSYLSSLDNKGIADSLVKTIPFSIFGLVYYFDTDSDLPDTSKGKGTISLSSSLDGMVSSLMGSTVSNEDMRDSFVRMLGGNDTVCDITIFPLDFDNIHLVTDHLDAWNDESLTLSVGGTEIAGNNRAEITYTNTLEIIISIINTMIDVISYALIAFTSISLVVSTVMIGIITYVSVVERIKEIGVIRSIGGRKKDVSHLFNAETFIIGLLAGIFGVAVTYLISLIVNFALADLINYVGIAALPWWQAIILVLLSVGLTLVSGLVPSKSAANKDPVVALRTE